jgi:hypothetical protein
MLSVILFLVMTLIGCGQKVEPGPPDTGARAAARAFFEAIIHEDWPTAFAAMDVEQAEIGVDAFTALAKQYRLSHGFEPRDVTFRGCEEQGERAVAHVVLTGKTPAGTQHFRDSVTLRKGQTGWKIIKLDGFGKQR